jgi:hypothetical protein
MRDSTAGLMHEKLLRNSQPVNTRPELFQIIVRENLIPDIVRHREKLYWDGLSARLPNGKRKFYGEVGATTKLKLELRRLALAGHWGDLRGVIVSWHRYTLLRDIVEGRTIRGGFESVSLWWPVNHIAANGKKR